MAAVMIGVDPHEGSHTAVVISPAPIRATSVKKAHGPDPVTTCSRRAGLTVLLGPSSQLPCGVPEVCLPCELLL
jgi:hypothetical protein